MGQMYVQAWQTGNTANSATYTCVITVGRSTYYGMNVNSYPIGVFDHNGLIQYIGWPLANRWRREWGTPDYRLTNGSWINSWWGGANGMLLPDYTYSFSRTVPINRGNSRKGTTSVNVGVRSSIENQYFNSYMVNVPLSTTEIPKVTITGNLTYTIDGPQVQNRYIKLNASYSNPENYYKAKLYDKNNKEIAVSEGTSISLNIPITKEMYQTNVNYTCKLWGKDGVCYDTKTTGTIYVEPSGVGVTVKNSGIHDVSTMNFRNVNTKEIKEVWIKKDGKVYQTRK